MALSLQEAEHYLAKTDPVMRGLIERQSITLPEARSDYFASLVRTIIGQQISVASARATYGRLETATAIEPARVYKLTSDEADAKAVGLSRQKAGYLHDLARHFVDNPAVYDHLERLEDNAVIAELVAIKGIGTWSAQMFLIFTLLRPDVFAPLDIGVQNAMSKLYSLEKPLDLKQLENIALTWSPYRSVALLHLWHSLDNVPVETPKTT